MTKGSTLILVGALWVLAGRWRLPDTGRCTGRRTDGSASVAAGYLYQFGTAIPGEGVHGLPRLRQRRRDGATGSRLARLALLTIARSTPSPDRPACRSLHLGTIHRIALSPSIIHSISTHWRILVSLPSAMRGGGVGARRFAGLRCGHLGTKTIGPDLSLGLGRGVSADRSVARIPFLSVRWRINDRWRLSNPLRVGPAGPAGLELACSLDRNWEAGAGGPTDRTDSGWTRAGPSPAVSERSGESLSSPPLKDVAARLEGGLVRGCRPGGKARHRKRTGDHIGSASFDPAPLGVCSSRGSSDVFGGGLRVSIEGVGGEENRMDRRLKEDFLNRWGNIRRCRVTRHLLVYRR